eukprot:scaffold63865_cov26-Tisochrysis_lutea.AAC.1
MSMKSMGVWKHASSFGGSEGAGLACAAKHIEGTVNTHKFGDLPELHGAVGTLQCLKPQGSQTSVRPLMLGVLCSLPLKHTAYWQVYPFFLSFSKATKSSCASMLFMDINRRIISSRSITPNAKEKSWSAVAQVWKHQNSMFASLQVQLLVVQHSSN